VLGVAALGHRKRLLAAIAALRGTVSPTASPEDKRPSPLSTPAERRQLTVLFCDLSGSTQLSQQLDPESLRTLMESYQRAYRTLVERYEGHVAQCLELSHVTLMALSRLDPRHAALLASRVAEGRVLTPSVLEQIQARTDGIPLFVEELTKAVIETTLLAAGDGRAGSPAIPATLRDSLMARLDRIGSAREVAQIASCIGREFDYRLLAAVAQVDAAKLDGALDQLIAAELVFQRGERPEATYQFKHALVQDAAYDSLLKTARVKLHRRIAEALEKDPSRLPGAGPVGRMPHPDLHRGLGEALVSR
jgi:hypothetical protein